MSFLLDANVFIQAHRFYYPMDVFPAFWEWLEEENTKGNICSIIPILDEITAGDDELSDWMTDLDRNDWFLPVDEEKVQLDFSEIVNWVSQQSLFKETAKKEFLSVADPWLIALGRSGYTVVTQEKSDPKSKKKIFIPDVCREFGVPCINTIELIRKLNGRF